MDRTQTIVAVATGIGGAISVIRVGGSEAIAICDKIFVAASGLPLSAAKGYTLHYGTIVDRNTTGGDSDTAISCDKSIIDDVVVSLFRGPKSYTGEDMVEISCHGSSYIQQEIIKLLIRHGARAAEPGEFTITAFLNGKLDLAQAEAVADMIAATDKATHALAMQQIRGGYSSEFQSLRARLIELVSLLELELDFGEEEVEFADRTQLLEVISEIMIRVERLLKSFSLGNSLKNGIPVAIIGEPNVGKSTLLNTLLNEDRAMVSEIAGTTRDIIEESLNIGGVRYRFIDTAGIRETTDRLEQMGIDRTHSTIQRARIVVLLVDVERGVDSLPDSLSALSLREDQKLCVVLNKIDAIDRDKLALLVERTNEYIRAYCAVASVAVDNLALADSAAAAGSSVTSSSVAVSAHTDVPTSTPALVEAPSPSPMSTTTVHVPLIAISAKRAEGVESLLGFLSEGVSAEPLYNGDTVVSNVRHYQALHQAQESLERAKESMMTDLSTDLLSQDIKETLHHLGMITGEITTDDILGSIFSKFCIGK